MSPAGNRGAHWIRPRFARGSQISDLRCRICLGSSCGDLNPEVRRPRLPYRWDGATWKREAGNWWSAVVFALAEPLHETEAINVRQLADLLHRRIRAKSIHRPGPRVGPVGTDEYRAHAVDRAAGFRSSRCYCRAALILRRSTFRGSGFRTGGSVCQLTQRSPQGTRP